LIFVEKLQVHFFFAQGFVQRLDFVYLIYFTATIIMDATAIAIAAMLSAWGVFDSAMNQS